MQIGTNYWDVNLKKNSVSALFLLFLLICQIFIFRNCWSSWKRIWSGEIRCFTRWQPDCFNFSWRMCKILEYQIPRGNIFVDFYKVMPGIRTKMFLTISSGLTFFDAFLKFSKSQITIKKKSGNNFWAKIIPAERPLSSKLQIIFFDVLKIFLQYFFKEN